MPKLGRFSGKEVCKILKRNGFTKIRQTGDHIVMQLNENGKTTTAIVPDHKEIKIGTLNSIIRQSGLSKNQFMK